MRLTVSTTREVATRTIWTIAPSMGKGQFSLSKQAVNLKSAAPGDYRGVDASRR